jgi:hypothetical protein
MQKHAKEKRTAMRRHEEKRQSSDKELAHNFDRNAEQGAPGKGKPDPEEGLGTVQNQKR